jgi:hypothetical protein
MRCYSECYDYDLEDLGNKAWLTGCPLCGDQCWTKGTKKERDELDQELDRNSLLSDNWVEISSPINSRKRK